MESKSFLCVEKHPTFARLSYDIESGLPHNDVMLEFLPLDITDACYINVHVLDCKETYEPTIRLDERDIDFVIKMLQTYKDRIKFWDNMNKIEEIEKEL